MKTVEFRLRYIWDDLKGSDYFVQSGHDESGEYVPAADVRELVEAAKKVPITYDRYRNKGVLPAPDEYQNMVVSILELKAALERIGEDER